MTKIDFSHIPHITVHISFAIKIYLISYEILLILKKCNQILVQVGSPLC
jgi:hypothetical protein